MNFFSCEECAGEKRELCEAAGAEQLASLVDVCLLGINSGTDEPGGDEEDVNDIANLLRVVAGGADLDEVLGDSPPDNSQEVRESLQGGVAGVDSFSNLYGCSLDKEERDMSMVLRSIVAHIRAGLIYRRLSAPDMQGESTPPINPSNN